MPGRGHGRLLNAPSTSANTGGYIEPWSRRHPDFMDNYNAQYSSNGRGRGRGRGRGVRTESNSGRGRGRLGQGLSGRDENQNLVLGSKRTDSTPKISSKEDEQSVVKPLDDIINRPKNDDRVAKPYDHLSNLVRICHINQTEYYATLPPDRVEQERNEHGDLIPCHCALFLWPGLKPKFPKFPSGRNPFDLLPVVKEGIYPFDTYGRLLFNKEYFDRWRANPKSADLLELQIRKLVQLNKLDGRWDQCFVPSEYQSYGTLNEWRFGRFEKNDVRPVIKDSAEPDSGFSESDFVSDEPWTGDNGIDRAKDKEKWEPFKGNHYVSTDGAEVGHIIDRIIFIF